jgi:hypothetical protein
MVPNVIPQKGKKTSTSNTAVKSDGQVLPACLGELFGRAPTLKSEDSKVYLDFMNEVVRCIKPANMIEWLWVKDA